MLTARIPGDLMDELTAAAEARRMTRSDAIREAVAEWITRPPSDAAEAA
jgi:predicted transcriptional regulator